MEWAPVSALPPRQLLLSLRSIFTCPQPFYLQAFAARIHDICGTCTVELRGVHTGNLATGGK
jgi:hypothetical protein